MNRLRKHADLLYVAVVMSLLIAALYVCLAIGEAKVHNYRPTPTPTTQGARP